MTSPGTLVGRPVVFNEPSLVNTPVGSFYEEIAPYAFNKLFARGGHREAILNVDHSPSTRALLARADAGTLEMSIGSLGLDVRSELPATTLGADVAEQVRRGDLRGMSFAFTVDDETGADWFERKDGTPHRVIREVHDLLDVSVVTFPQYSGTKVSVGAGKRSAAPPAVARRYASLALRLSLERRGRPSDCPPRLKFWMRLRGKRVVRTSPVSFDVGASSFARAR